MATTPSRQAVCATTTHANPSSRCCEAGAACGSNEACLRAAVCSWQCTTEACVAACRAQNPEGADAFDALASCAVSRCQDACFDDVGCDLVLTTGGTGPARRDVTPEATLAISTREMPGFGEQMRRISLECVPTAILSRQVGSLREEPGHAALILNLPGQPGR